MGGGSGVAQVNAFSHSPQSAQCQNHPVGNQPHAITYRSKQALTVHIGENINGLINEALSMSTPIIGGLGGVGIDTSWGAPTSLCTVRTVTCNLIAICTRQQHLRRYER